MDKAFSNIRAELARNKMTIGDLAKYLDIERKTFYNWELKGDFPAKYIEPMAKRFRVSADYILGIDTNQNGE